MSGPMSLTLPEPSSRPIGLMPRRSIIDRSLPPPSNEVSRPTYFCICQLNASKSIHYIVSVLYDHEFTIYLIRHLYLYHA